MQTCGELADASAAAVGKFRVVGFARLLELHTALRRRRLVEDSNATSGGGSGAVGNGTDSGGGTGSRADGGEGRGRLLARKEDDVQPIEEEEPSAMEVKPSAMEEEPSAIERSRRPTMLQP